MDRHYAACPGLDRVYRLVYGAFLPEFYRGTGLAAVLNLLVLQSTRDVGDEDDAPGNALVHCAGRNCSLSIHIASPAGLLAACHGLFLCDGMVGNEPLLLPIALSGRESVR